MRIGTWAVRAWPSCTSSCGRATAGMEMAVVVVSVAGIVADMVTVGVTTGTTTTVAASALAMVALTFTLGVGVGVGIKLIKAGVAVMRAVAVMVAAASPSGSACDSSGELVGVCVAVGEERGLFVARGVTVGSGATLPGTAPAWALATQPPMINRMSSQPIECTRLVMTTDCLKSTKTTTINRTTSSV